MYRVDKICRIAINVMGDLSALSSSSKRAVTSSVSDVVTRTIVSSAFE